MVEDDVEVVADEGVAGGAPWVGAAVAESRVGQVEALERDPGAVGEALELDQKARLIAVGGHRLAEHHELVVVGRRTTARLRAGGSRLLGLGDLAAGAGRRRRFRPFGLLALRARGRRSRSRSARRATATASDGRARCASWRGPRPRHQRVDRLSALGALVRGRVLLCWTCCWASATCVPPRSSGRVCRWAPSGLGGGGRGLRPAVAAWSPGGVRRAELDRVKGRDHLELRDEARAEHPRAPALAAAARPVLAGRRRGGPSCTTVTLVTPSMSCSDADEPGHGLVAGRATLDLQRGPGDALGVHRGRARARARGARSRRSRRRLASMFVSQTSFGITIASSRSTRSQSNRLCARVETVCSRACCIEAKSANDLRRSACRLRLGELGLEARLLGLAVRDLVVGQARSTSPRSAPPRARRRPRRRSGPVRIGALLAAALLGRDQVDGAHRLLLQREAEGEGQPGRRRARRGRREARGRPTSEPLPQVVAGGARRGRGSCAGAAGDDALDRDRALLRGVVLERQAKLVDQPRRALARAPRARPRRVSGSPSTSPAAARGRRATSHCRACSSVSCAALGELLRDALDAERRRSA